MTINSKTLIEPGNILYFSKDASWVEVDIIVEVVAVDSCDDVIYFIILQDEYDDTDLGARGEINEISGEKLDEFIASEDIIKLG